MSFFKFNFVGKISVSFCFRFLDGGQILFVYDYLKVVVMSTRRSNREGMGEDEFFDTSRPSGGYLDSVTSRLRGAISTVCPDYGSPTQADAKGRIH